MMRRWMLVSTLWAAGTAAAQAAPWTGMTVWLKNGNRTLRVRGEVRTTKGGCRPGYRGQPEGFSGRRMGEGGGLGGGHDGVLLT